LSKNRWAILRSKSITVFYFEIAITIPIKNPFRINHDPIPFRKQVPILNEKT